MSFLAFIMAAALASGDASTQQAAATDHPSAASAKNAPDPNRVVCRKEQVTGSRFWKRICMTQGEWDQQTVEAQRNQDRINQRAGMGQAMGGGGMGGG